MTLREFISSAKKSLSGLYPMEEASSIVSVLLEDLLGLSRTDIFLKGGETLPSSDAELLQDGLKRLLCGEPVQYVTGKASFYGREFKVSPSVLIPRCETELLVREAIGMSNGGERILDLCTGSGCIAWTLASEIPNSEVVGVDISEDALDIALSQNIPIPNPPKFLAADVLNFPQSPYYTSHCQIDWQSPRFDMLVSNPPYVLEKERTAMRPNVLDHEPDLALFVPDGDPLLFYRAIARIGAELNIPKGIVEINEAFGAQTKAVFETFGYSKTAVLRDFCAKNRFVRFEK